MVIDRLPVRSRLQQALHEAEQVRDYEAVPVANTLVEHGHAAEAAVVRRGNHALLVELHLDEDNVAAAIEAYPGAERPSGALRMRLAKACETAYPAMTAALYREQVEALTAVRNRTAYAEAAQLLLKVRAMMTATAEQSGWEAYFNEFLARHSRLHALKDEARQAGLPVT